MARTVRYINQEEIEPDQIRQYMEPLLKSATDFARAEGLEVDSAELSGGWYDNGSFGLFWDIPDTESRIAVYGVDNDAGTVDTELSEAFVED